VSPSFFRKSPFYFLGLSEEWRTHHQFCKSCKGLFLLPPLCFLLSCLADPWSSWSPCLPQPILQAYLSLQLQHWLAI
jgi:hypothetical protein